MKPKLKQRLSFPSRKFLEKISLICLFPSYFSSVAKQCHVIHVLALLPKANIPSFASLIAQPPCAAPKPTFLAFWGLAHSSPVPFHISPEMTALAPTLLLLLVIVHEDQSQKVGWSQGQQSCMCQSDPEQCCQPQPPAGHRRCR